MAAKNPRWPSKNQFFDIQAPKLKESDRTQRTKKLHWNILNTLKEKNQVIQIIFE